MSLPVAAWSLARGACAGAAGAGAGHLAVILAHRGGFSPGLFPGDFMLDLALSTAAYYGCLGAGLFESRSALRGAWAGFAPAFAGIAAPVGAAMAVYPWGGRLAPSLTGIVLAAYAAGNALSIGAIGFFSCSPKSWRRALGALSGAGVAQALQTAWLLSHPRQVEVIGWLPPPSALYNGTLWGALIGAGMGLGSKPHAAKEAANA